MQISKSRCKSASVYVAVRAGSGAEVNLGVDLGSGEPGAEPGPRKPRLVVFGVLAGPFLFAVVSIGAESLFGLLEIAETL